MLESMLSSAVGVALGRSSISPKPLVDDDAMEYSRANSAALEMAKAGTPSTVSKVNGKWVAAPTN